jgi:PAS domain S-box-containing protein
MNNFYYTPYLLPMFAFASFVVALGLYAWDRRSVPGAGPFALWMLFTALLEVSYALEAASADFDTAVFWFKLQRTCLLFIAISGLGFALEYADLGRWPTRRLFTLMSAPLLVAVLLVFTNEAHHLVWIRLWLVDGQVHFTRGWMNWPLHGYGILLYGGCYVSLIGLFVRSPLHRWPAGVCLVAQSGGFADYLLTIAARMHPLGALEQHFLALVFMAVVYSLALFRLRMFDLIPVAREMVVEQVQDGLVVLDTQQRVVDLNPAAEKILGIPVRRARGRPASEVLHLGPDWGALLDGAGAGPFQTALETDATPRHFEVSVSPLKKSLGLPLGHLVLYHDVTEQRRAQAQLLADQRMVAALEERERLARELHDTLVQTLAAMRMQAETAGLLLERGETTTGRAHLTRLADAAQAAYLDLRDYIRGVGAAREAGQDFFPALRQYLAQFDQNYEFTTRLVAPSALEQARLAEQPARQVLRIIQEGLHNVRKHAATNCATVRFALNGPQAEVHIEDEGHGFDPEQLTAEGEGFGLRSMRERAESIGGAFQIHSTPGQGTHIVVTWPNHHPVSL